MNAHPDCDGCQWQNMGKADHHCYMFATAPETLPCTQHDKFNDVREAIVKQPKLVKMMMLGLILAQEE